MQRSRKDQTSFADANGNYNFGDRCRANPSTPATDSPMRCSASINTFSQASTYINGMYRYWNIEQYRPGHLEGNARPDAGLRSARRLVPAAVRLFAAGIHLRSSASGMPAKAPRLYQPAIIPAPTPGDRLRSGYQHLSAVLRRRPRDSQFRHRRSNGICQAGTCVRQVPVQEPRPAVGSRVSASPGTSPANRISCSAPAAAFTMTAYRATASSTPCPIRPKRSAPPLNQNGFQHQSHERSARPAQREYGGPHRQDSDYVSYQFSLQYRLPENMMLDVAYVGSQSRHQQNNRNLNYNPFGQCFQPQNQDPQRVAASPTALLGNNCKDANFMKPYPGLRQHQPVREPGHLELQRASGAGAAARHQGSVPRRFVHLEQGHGNRAERRHQRQRFRPPRSVQPAWPTTDRPASTAARYWPSTTSTPLRRWSAETSPPN